MAAASRAGIRGNGATATVGRKRIAQAKRVRDTDAGRFGKHLESLIAECNLTVPEFASKIGTSAAVVYYYISGDRIPPFKHWRKIASALGLKSVNDLLPKLPIS